MPQRGIRKPSLRERIFGAPRAVPGFFQRRTRFISGHPLASFLVALLLLLGLIIAGNALFKPKTTEVKQPQVVKDVQVYSIGTGPKMSVQAQIEKAGVVKIVAQAPGVIQQINVSEGDQVGKFANLIQLSSTYDGGNAPGIQSAIAAKQYQLAKDTFDTQKDIIQKQRDIANATRANTEELRNISSQSASDTQSLINTNNDLLGALNDQLTTLSNNNTNNVNLQAIIQTRGQISQLQGAQAQLQAQQRNLQLQSDTSKPPTQLADLQKDLTLKQLDVQEKSIEINKQVAGLQASLAAVNASMMHPTAPFSGKIDKIYVHQGDVVNPGTPLLLLSGDTQTTSVVATLPQDIALKVSAYQPSTLHLSNTSVDVIPTYVSQEATDGQFYTVRFAVPDGYTQNLADKQFVTVDMPVAEAQTSSSIPFIPIDSVFQAQDQSVVHIVQNGVVKSKTVKLGQVMDQFVEVTEGLSSGDQIILNRNVIDGDKVKIQ